jgi:hypothetical protein
MAIINSGNWSTRSANEDGGFYIQQTDVSYGTFLNSQGIAFGPNVYTWEIRFEEQGRQVFEVSADEEAQFYIDAEQIGTFGFNAGSTLLATDRYYEEGSIHRITIISTDEGNPPGQVAAEWNSSIYSPVVINSFQALPSNNLINTSEVTLEWEVFNAIKVEIDNNVGDQPPVSGNIFIDTFLKSNVPDNSPASKTYTLYAYGNVPSDVISETVTILVRNDDIVDIQSIGPFFNEEPLTTVVKNIGALSGIDQPITVNGGTGVDVQVNGGGFSSSGVTADPGANIDIRFTTLDYNTNIGEGQSALPNVQTLQVSFGPIVRAFQVGTRPPESEEVFDFADNDTVVPFPDTAPDGIYTGTDPSLPYVESPTIVEPTFLEWELELSDPAGFELRTTRNTEAQVRVTDGDSGIIRIDWTNPEKLFDDLTDTFPRTIADQDWSQITERDGTILNNTTPYNDIQLRSSAVISSKNILPS